MFFMYMFSARRSLINTKTLLVQIFWASFSHFCMKAVEMAQIIFGFV